MNLYPLFILSLLLAVLTVSLIRIFHLPFSKIRRFTLSAIRIVLILLITIAFFEPSFQFERLPPQNRNIAVLIDNSKSMSLFSPESTVIPFVNILRSINKKSSVKNNRFVFYSFGDSLKKAADSLTFFENKSTFPIITNNNSIDKSSSIIIISDANWSNSVQLSSMVENRSLYYLRLPKSHQNNQLHSDIKNIPASSKDSTHFIFDISGFSTNSLPLTVRCVSYDKPLFEKVIDIKPGNIRETLNFNLKKFSPGTHILRFQILTGDSIINEYRHVHTVSREVFFYHTQFTTPTLDNRFLQLAFSRDSSFMATSSDTADLLIISDNKKNVSTALSSVSKNGLLFFAGTLPCEPLKRTTTNTLIADFSSYSAFNRSGTVSLPPISVYRNCLSSPAERIFAWVSSGQEHSDTIPALFTTSYRNNTALILSLENFWKWDFYPLVSELGEENTFTFSRRIVNAVKEILSFQSSSVYTAVVRNGITDTDPFTLDHSLPRSIGFKDTITLRCTVQKGGIAVLDSSISMIHDGTGKLHTVFNPVSSGNYRYTTILRNGDKQYTYTDSVHINTDNSEYSISGQNEYILTGNARPITQTDTSMLENILNESNSVSILPLKQSVTLSRNWPLILLIFVTYGIELFLRRRWRLD